MASFLNAIANAANLGKIKTINTTDLVKNAIDSDKISLKSTVGSLENLKKESNLRCLENGKKVAVNGAVALSLIPRGLNLFIGATVTALTFLANSSSSSAKENHAEEKQKANNLRENLGAGFPESILNEEVATPNGNKSIENLAEEYREKLGSKLSNEEMLAYINMGQRIVEALGEQGENYNGGPINVRDNDGNNHVVPPNLDTARAISWYVQAKAMKDNASENREPVMLNRGSMVMSDPGNKLYKFLRSAPNTYGRASTHYNERSLKKAHFNNTGVAGKAINSKNALFNCLRASGKQVRPAAAQLGIEDFSNKFPSGKGCLLFDKMQDADAPQNAPDQLFMKWESAGMPNFLHSPAQHADPESGPVARMAYRFGAFDRCMQHTFNFAKMNRSSNDWGIHRESVKKGNSKAIYDQFNSAMKQLQSDNKHNDWAKSMKTEAKIRGVEFMLDVLNSIQNEYEEGGVDFPESMQKLIHDIEDFKTSHGEDLGIRRKGEEIHLNPYNDRAPAIAAVNQNHNQDADSTLSGKTETHKPSIEELI
ncbi:hypothetical protein TDB9533_03046 [Thalassocella blandensis]|nr:hypothetical protein TDB9533_03046 [Thalassocella blandensis]